MTHQKLKEEWDKIVSEELTIEKGGFVNESDAQEYANTGWDIEVIEKWVFSAIDKVVQAEREQIKDEIRKSYNYPCKCLHKQEDCPHDFRNLYLAIDIINCLQEK